MGVHLPGGLVLHIAPDRLDVARALLRWLVRTAQGPVLSIDVFDDQARGLLSRAGFEPATEPFGFYQRSTPGLSAPISDVRGKVPASYSIRGVGPDEAHARVAVHRAA